LNNACSVVFNNTLYTYSADAFQSLRLEPGAEWEELVQGVKVKGGVCVGSTTGTASTSAFFVVGGVGGSDEYDGLQKYTYATGRWESIKLESRVTHQREGHGAVYINSTDEILVCAGSRDGSRNPSQETYLIGASAPYGTLSDPTGTKQALFNPIMLPWSAGEAVVLGGSTSNQQVMLYNAYEKRWIESGASLATPLPKDTSAMQAVLMTGDDGSKNLITFDMTVSPNEVRRTVLSEGPGKPVPNSAPVRRQIRGRTEHSKKRQAAEPLTVHNWPAYNSTLAPKTTRSNYALAQGPDGMVVIAGGNDKEVLAMFNARENTWEDAEDNLGQIRLLSVSSSTSSSATASSTTSSLASSTTAPTTVTSPAAATETAVPGASDSDGTPLHTILGAVLGGVFGLAILLILVYMCIKKRNRRQAHMEAGHARRASGASSSEKDGIGFAKESLALGQGPPGVFRGHQQQDSHSSVSSMAILMGRGGQHKTAPSGLGRKSSNDSGRNSHDPTFKDFKSTIGKPMPQSAPPPAAVRSQPHAWDEKGMEAAASNVEPKRRTLTAGADKQGTTRRSSGWNRYWSGGSALNLLGFGNGGGGNSNNNAAANNSRRTTLASDRSSNYSNPHRMTQDSATVPPLFPGASELRMSFSRVNAHSPTIAVYNDKLTEGLSGHIETQRPISSVSDMSASAYSSGIPESVHESWDPTAANKPWGADRSLNDSSTGIYTTPLAPASQGLKPPTQGSSRPAPPKQQPPVRDDMSWLNLGNSS
jgi:hypothetical protein